MTEGHAEGAVLEVEEHILDYERPYLYPKQLEAIFDPRRYALIEASTKAGKTSGCIVWLIERALAGQEAFNYWWVAPVSGQADIAFRRALRALPRDMAQANISLKTITLINGAVLWFKSGDKPDSLYGDDVHAAVVDEASRLKEEAWYAVRSTLTATQGPVRIIGNVKGRRNWFYHMARRAEAGDPAMGYHHLTAYDAVQANVLSIEDVEDARRTLPDHVFRQLYLAEPTDDDGNPFGLTAIARCVAPMSSRPAHALGWDFGKKVDYTVGIGLDDDGYTSFFDRFQLPWDVTLDRVKKATKKRRALCDATGIGDPIIELLQKEPGSNYEGYIFTGPSKQMLMEGLSVAIQSGTVHFPDGVIKLELEAFEYEHTRTGVRYAAPEGYHDDCVCALALAVMHRSHASPPMVITPEILARAAEQKRRRF